MTDTSKTPPPEPYDLDNRQRQTSHCRLQLQSPETKFR